MAYDAANNLLVERVKAKPLPTAPCGQTDVASGGANRAHVRCDEPRQDDRATGRYAVNVVYLRRTAGQHQQCGSSGKALDEHVRLQQP